MQKDNHPTAISGKGNLPYEEEFRTLGQILQRDAEPIMERWFERATEEQLHAPENEREDSMDDLLNMLKSIGRRLEDQTGSALEDAAEIAREHGLQRLGLKWDIGSVVRDYEILHGVVLEHLGKVVSERLTYRQAMIIASVVDRATASAVQAFSEMTNRRFESQIKRQREELRQLVLDLTESEHSERQRIAQTLHDDFQQLLVATRMRLQSAICVPSPDPAALEGVQNLLDQMLEAARDLSRELHPTMLESAGLPAAIESMAECFEERHNLKVTVDLQVPKELKPGPMTLRRLVYDGVRELLFNVVKHGQTGQAWVRISETDPYQWNFEVEDRGAGFSRINPEKSAAPTGLGLSDIRRRIEQVGGKVEIDSKVGRGTRISFVVPMEAEENQEEHS